ncbi:MAG: GlsB/YeaQ/YmgE family stress response membrane protein [Pirellulales bacterium]
MDFMEILRMIVFGFVIGVIARFLMPGPQPMGLILTTILGIAGSFLGGYLGHLLHHEPIDVWQPAGWIGSIIGAALLLFGYGFLKKKQV